jgi:predicted RNA-binding protein with TRAM domain
MELPDRLRCLFSAQLEQRDGTYVLEIPEQELRLGGIRDDETYQVAILPCGTAGGQARAELEQSNDSLEPPVAEGEHRVVEIESFGEQGDGIARVERGFVVIIPDTELHERVRIEIRDVRQTVAFAEVVERISYYE